ncbi:HPF/RaiA family ribosome-associated protein [Chryseosolibacter indicus]|uniref:HPF/RaiA family ribosome-associated protein n=1 Tax=Chryseosolibacter indicus TaxID=2782351 RepID=A0ABS5VTL4_9BACT|nr:HPF/RaiA family ribosome-associated protein [Chryseosolibacter indicus]MBT1704747.1 HPF/RaiA family ribosome-associated protein [Chryseosolibacter indicus]
MNIKTQTPGFIATDELLNYINDHVSKLSIVSDRIIEAQVCLKVEKSDTRENKFCEVKLVIPGNDLFASAHKQSFEEAVTTSVNALRQQVVKWKESQNAKTQRGVTIKG